MKWARSGRERKKKGQTKSEDDAHKVHLEAGETK